MRKVIVLMCFCVTVAVATLAAEPDLHFCSPVPTAIVIAWWGSLQLVADTATADSISAVQTQQPSSKKDERKQSSPATSNQGNPNTKVWVNTSSGVYHCPGTRWYGATKHGEYMTQKDAQQKGNRPAYGKYCD